MEEKGRMPEHRTITFGDEEKILDGSRGRPVIPLTRADTMMSQVSRASRASSQHSLNRRSVDPAVALPLRYKTVSYTVDNDRVSQHSRVVKKRTPADKTAALVGDLDWHTLTVDALAQRLATSTETGLRASDVTSLLAQYGPNRPSKPPRHLFRRIFNYFFGGFGPILFVGGILVFISWKPLGQPPAKANLALAIILEAVFLIQAAFNAWQDFSSSRVMSSITGMLPEGSIVIRDGQQMEVEAANIVPGDVLLFKAGNKLPADVRFVEVSTDAKFDRSILTGESLPLGASVTSTDENYMETRSIGMQGTYCTSGSGKGVVVSTGDNTVFGQIAKLTSAPQTRRSPLQKQVLYFVLVIASIMLFMIVVVLIIWGAYLRPKHHDWINVPTLIVDLVSVGIAFVPEGLPIAITASLTICASAMRRNNILCKSLSTVETLGSISVLLSDKTGTLTKNQMKATDCSVGLESTPVPQAVETMQKGGRQVSSLKQLMVASAICNAAEFDATTMDEDIDSRTVIGDATDQACLRFSESLGSVAHSRSLWTKLFDLSFNSKNKYMLRLFKVSNEDPANAISSTLGPHGAGNFDEKQWLLMIKGAPDILMQRCTQLVDGDGNITELTAEDKLKLEVVKDQWSREGKRVIAVARKTLRPEQVGNPQGAEFEDEAKEHAMNGLTLIGLIGIVDPPREEIPGVIWTLHEAGIRVMMVTGDFKLTAQAIAQQCGILTSDGPFIDGVEDLLPCEDDSKVVDISASGNTSASEQWTKPRKSLVLSGSELNTLSEEEWDAVCDYQEIVFARTTPEQKLRIVKEFQARKSIVGMTGDGVNDAPSLKQADVGVAPGVASDMALEAADMILLDSFSAITEAVLYGRLAFDNLKKTITYLLPAGSFSEFWPLMTNVAFGLPQVLSSFLMIIICCFTDCAAGIALAYEKPEADLMKRPPRGRNSYLVDWKLLLYAYGFIGMLETTLSFTMSYWYCQSQGLKFSDLWFKYGELPATMDQDTYNSILNTASSIYFANLIIMQFFVIFAVRTRRMSVFQHPPLFNKKTDNWRVFPAILFAFGIIWIFCYPKKITAIFGSAPIPVAHWFLPIALGAGVLLLDEGRKALVRRYPQGILARVAW